MKTIPMPRIEDDEQHDAWMNDGNKGYADWKDRARDVLDTMDRVLKNVGFEVVQYDTGADYYLWKVEKIDA